jgi:hypothetical protein
MKKQKGCRKINYLHKVMANPGLKCTFPDFLHVFFPPHPPSWNQQEITPASDVSFNEVPKRTISSFSSTPPEVQALTAKL